jgi:hypothetical protein
VGAIDREFRGLSTCRSTADSYHRDTEPVSMESATTSAARRCRNEQRCLPPRTSLGVQWRCSQIQRRLPNGVTNDIDYSRSSVTTGIR